MDPSFYRNYLDNNYYTTTTATTNNNDDKNFKDPSIFFLIKKFSVKTS